MAPMARNASPDFFRPRPAVWIPRLSEVAHLPGVSTGLGFGPVKSCLIVCSGFKLAMAHLLRYTATGGVLPRRTHVESAISIGVCERICHGSSGRCFAQGAERTPE